MLTSYFGLNFANEFQSGVMGVPGWNNVFPTHQFQKDLDDNYTLGIRYARISFQAWNGDPNIIAIQDNCAAMAKAKGYNVSYGLGQFAGAKPSDWPPFLVAQLAHAQKIQLAATTDVYALGNENEFFGNLGRDIIVSMTRVSGVVTVVMALPNSLHTGDSVNFLNAATGNGSGSTIGIPSNSFISNITVINSTTFTFTNAGSDATTTVGWFQLTEGTVYDIIRRQATALKAAGITMKLSYSCFQSVDSAQAGHYYITSFATRGDLDYVDLNMYGTQGFPVKQSLDAYLEDFKACINAGYNLFGPDHFRVTEWSANSQTTAIKPTDSETLTRYQIARLDFCQTKSGLIHFLFCYRERAESDAFDAVKPYNVIKGAVWRDWWYAMIAKRAPTVEVQFGNPTPVQSVRVLPVVITNNLTKFNYGQINQSGTGFYNQSQEAIDLGNFSTWGVDKLRMPFGSLTFTSGVTACKEAMLQALLAGQYVIGACQGAAYGQETDASWAIHVNDVITIAGWANSVGLSELCISNELEASESQGTLTDAYGKVLALAATIKGLYPNLKLSSSLAQDQTSKVYGILFESVYGQNGIGMLDRLGYNSYGDVFSTPAQNIAFVTSRLALLMPLGSTKLYISEWSLPYPFPFTIPLAQQGTEILAKVALFQSLGLENYFFCYSWAFSNGNSGTPDYYALLLSNGTFISTWFSALFTPIPRDKAGIRDVAVGRDLI